MPSPVSVPRAASMCPSIPWRGAQKSEPRLPDRHTPTLRVSGKGGNGFGDLVNNIPNEPGHLYQFKQHR